MNLASQDVAFVDRWRRGLEQHCTMQTVRDAIEKGDLEEARNSLEDLLGRLGGPDVLRVKTMLAHVEEKLLGRDKDELIRRRETVNTQSDEDLIVYLDDLKKMAMRLQSQIETAQNAEKWQDYVKLAAWRVEIDLLRAALSPDDACQTIFNIIPDYTRDLGARYSQVSQTNNLPASYRAYERLSKIASKAKDIQRAIRLYKEHLTIEAPIDRFQEALQAWNDHIQPYADQTALAIFKARYDERVRQMINVLHEKAQQQDDLPSYAKLKLLDNPLGDQLIDKLRGISGRWNRNSVASSTRFTMPAASAIWIDLSASKLRFRALKLR